MSSNIDFKHLFSKIKVNIKDKAANTYSTLFKKNEDLTRENLLTILQRHNRPSDFLNYRSYHEIPLDENNNLGIYTMNDGRMGVVYKLHSSGYPNEKVQEKFEAIIESIIGSGQTNGICFNFTSFASQNIDDILKEYEQLHTCDVNIRNKHVLKTLVAKDIAYNKKWTKQSCADAFDYRVRNIQNLFSVIFPHNMHIDDIKNVHNLLIGSAGNDLNPKPVSGQHFIELMYEIFHIPTEDFKQVINSKIPMNKIVSPPGTRINVNKGRITFNKDEKPTYADVFSVAAYPEDTSLFSTINAFFDILRKNIMNPLPCPFVNSVTIKVENVQKKADKILEKTRWDYERLSGIGVKDKKKEPELEERFRECKDVIDKISKQKKYFVDVIWNLTVLETNQSRLTKYGQTIIRSFGDKGWKVVRESFDNIALLKMIYTLPLQDDNDVYTLLNRTVPLLVEDVAKIIPLIGDNVGYGSPYITYMSPSGQLQAFDPMASLTNYNVVVTGTSGAGKSYGISSFLYQMLAAGTKIRMIDVGKSYRDLCKIFGGQYIEFSHDANYCLNFFTNVPTEKRKVVENGVEVEIETIEKVNAENIVAIIGIMAGLGFMAETLDDKIAYLKGKVQQAVNDAFRHRGGRKADLRHVHEYLKQYSHTEKTTGGLENASLLDRLISAMYNFADPMGQYYSFFNGPANLKFDSDFIVLELDELKDLKDLYPIVVFMLAQFAFNEFFIEYHKNPTMRSLFGVDEAPMMFGNEIIVNLLEAFYRRIRKYNGLALTAAQNISDFNVNNATRAMFANAAWKINHKASKDELHKAIKDGIITPNPLEIQLYESIAPNPPYYGELLLKSEFGLMVSRVKSTPYNHYLLTQREADKRIIQAALRNYFNGNPDEEINARLYVAMYKEILEDTGKKPSVNNVISKIEELKSENKQVA